MAEPEAPEVRLARIEEKVGFILTTMNRFETAFTLMSDSIVKKQELIDLETALTQRVLDKERELVEYRAEKAKEFAEYKADRVKEYMELKAKIEAGVEKMDTKYVKKDTFNVYAAIFGIIGTACLLYLLNQMIFPNIFK